MSLSSLRPVEVLSAPVKLEALPTPPPQQVVEIDEQEQEERRGGVSTSTRSEENMAEQKETPPKDEASTFLPLPLPQASKERYPPGCIVLYNQSAEDGVVFPKIGKVEDVLIDILPPRPTVYRIAPLNGDDRSRPTCVENNVLFGQTATVWMFYSWNNNLNLNIPLVDSTSPTIPSKWISAIVVGSYSHTEKSFYSVQVAEDNLPQTVLHNIPQSIVRYRAPGSNPPEIPKKEEEARSTPQHQPEKKEDPTLTSLSQKQIKSSPSKQDRKAKDEQKMIPRVTSSNDQSVITQGRIYFPSWVHEKDIDGALGDKIYNMVERATNFGLKHLKEARTVNTTKEKRRSYLLVKGNKSIKVRCAFNLLIDHLCSSISSLPTEEDRSTLKCYLEQHLVIDNKDTTTSPQESMCTIKTPPAEQQSHNKRKIVESVTDSAETKRKAVTECTENVSQTSSSSSEQHANKKRKSNPPTVSLIDLSDEESTRIDIPSWVDKRPIKAKLFGTDGSILQSIMDETNCSIQPVNPHGLIINGSTSEVRNAAIVLENIIVNTVSVAMRPKVLYDLASKKTNSGTLINVPVKQRSPDDMEKMVWMTVIELPPDFRNYIGLFIGRNYSGLKKMEQKTNCRVTLFENFVYIQGEHEAAVQKCSDNVRGTLKWANETHEREKYQAQRY